MLRFKTEIRNPSLFSTSHDWSVVVPAGSGIYLSPRGDCLAFNLDTADMFVVTANY